MSTESATYIEDFDDTRPDGATENGNVLDNQIQMMKTVLVAQLGALGATNLTATGAQINGLFDGTSEEDVDVGKLIVNETGTSYKMELHHDTDAGDIALTPSDSGGTLQTASRLYYDSSEDMWRGPGLPRRKHSVTGYSQGLLYAPYEANSLGSALDVSGISTAETIGPAGSGATNIWSAMDNLPTDTTHIDLELFVTVAFSAAGSYSPYPVNSGNTAAGSYWGILSSEGIATLSQQMKMPVYLDSSSNIFKFASDQVNVSAVSTANLKMRGFWYA